VSNKEDTMMAPTLILLTALSLAGTKGTPAPAIQPGHRIAGAASFKMPDLLELKMNTEEQPEVDYRGVVCVGADGVPRSIKPVQRTGVRQADRKVERTVMGWRYSPLRVHGRATPFCTGFRYRFEIPHQGPVNRVG
jgi:hypothetical protein